MKQICIDHEVEAVKRFVRSLVSEGEGALLEWEGRPVVCVLPAPQPNGDDQGPWSEEKNARRCHLVDRDIDGTLTPAEMVELARLEREMSAYLRRAAPLPLEETRALYRELLAKSLKAEGGKG